MMNMHEGLWGFTKMILLEIEKANFEVPKIEPHDKCDVENPDFIWGDVTPNLMLSEGEYMSVSHTGSEQCFFVDFGTRATVGSDPTYDFLSCVEPTEENAVKAAKMFLEKFG